MKLTNYYRPKADRGLLRDLIAEAWQAYHDEQFPAWEQESTGLMLASLLEQRFPPDDMTILAKYGQATAPEQVSINIYDPSHQRWDCYTSVKLPRQVLCPQGRAHFFVGGNHVGSTGRVRNDCLPVDFEPYFNKILTARKAYNAEVTFRPERIDGSYPTWEQIAAQLPVAGPHIRRTIK